MKVAARVAAAETLAAQVVLSTAFGSACFSWSGASSRPARIVDVCVPPRSSGGFVDRFILRDAAEHVVSGQREPSPSSANDLEGRFRAHLVVERVDHQLARPRGSPRRARSGARGR